MLIRIEAPWFVAGVETKPPPYVPKGDLLWPRLDERVTRTAPILGYMLSWPEGRVYAYCRKRGWTWLVLP